MNKDFSKIAQENLWKLYNEMILSEYNFPTKPSSDGYYHLNLRTATGRTQIKAKNLDKLKEKVIQLNQKTFKQVYELTKEEKLKYTKNPEKLLSVRNTIKVNDSIYARFIAGTDLEQTPVTNITKNSIEDFCLDTLTNNDVNQKSFMNLRCILKSVLKYAYDQYWITDNPYSRINFRKYNDMLTTSTPITKRMHTQEEIDRMLNYLHDKQISQPDYMPAWALELQILMGLRRGEIAPLKWSDIYDDTIHINKEQITILETQECVIVDHTKTYVDRVFPITNIIAEYLDRLAAVSTGEYLFPYGDGVINNNVVYKLYQRMCRRLNITISRDAIKGPHSFRRNGITNICNRGGNIELAATLYGNSPLSITKHYYGGVNVAEAKRILENGNQ